MANWLRRVIIPQRNQAPPRGATAGRALATRSTGWSWPQQYALSQSFRNDRTGAGGASDLSVGGHFELSNLLSLSKSLLENTYIKSWAAKKFIDIPVVDSFVRWRQFDEDSDAMVQAEKEHKVRKRLSATLRSARLTGTGLLIMLTKEDDTETELDTEAIREGDLSNLIVADKFDATIAEIYTDPFSPQFRQPRLYDINVLAGVMMRVHASRVIRIDGIEPPVPHGWEFGYQWGLSELEPVIKPILNETAVMNSSAHLTEEASVTILKMDGVREHLAGFAEDDRADWFATMQNILNTKSNYRTMVADQTDEVSRLAVTFSGIPEMIDRFARQIAAAADIPATRFWGQSPLGMNATGEGDMVNYAMTVSEHQREKLDPALERLDVVLARSAGLSEPPPYKWNSLIDLSDKDSANISKLKMEVATGLLREHVIDELEARAMLSGDAFVGELSNELPEGLLEPVQMPLIGEGFPPGNAPPVPQEKNQPPGE